MIFEQLLTAEFINSNKSAINPFEMGKEINFNYLLFVDFTIFFHNQLWSSWSPGRGGGVASKSSGEGYQV